MNRIRSLLLAAAIIAALAAATPASAQPVRNPAPVPQARICIAKQLTCIRYVVIFGRYVCTAKQLTCIRWL